MVKTYIKTQEIILNNPNLSVFFVHYINWPHRALTQNSNQITKDLRVSLV